MKFYQQFLPYALAIASTAIALLLRLWLEPFLTDSVSPFFFVAITVSTWYGGLRPGFVSIVLSTLAIKTFFVPPLGQLTNITTSDVIRFASFCLVALVIHLLSRNLRNSKNRKQTEIALQETQNQLQRQLAEIETIYQSAPIGLNVLDTEFRFVRINQRLAEINGFSVEAHIGRTIRELLPDLADNAEQLLRPILETGEPLLNVEITGETPAQPGVKRIWLESFLPLKDGERIIGISTVCEEITERKRAEQTLAKELLRIQTLFNTSFDGIVILDRQGNVLDANPRFAEMLGYTPEETAKLTIFDWDAQFKREELQQLMRDSLGLKNGVLETRHRRKDGSIYDVEISFSVQEWEGEILRFCTCRDISDRQLAQEALRQSEERYRTLFDSIDEGFCIIEMLFDENEKPVDYRFLEINRQFEKQTGLQQALGKTARQLLPNLEEHWFEIYGQVALTGEPLRFENGSEVMNRWFDVYALRVGQPSSRKVAVVFKDITARKRAEMALKQLNAELEQRVAERTAQLREVNDRLLETVREQQLTQLILLEQAQLLDLAHDTILTRDLNGLITFWNEGAKQMYGWTKAEALGQEIYTFLQTRFPKPLAEIESELREKGYWEGELIHTRRDGLTINVSSSWVMQKDEMGRPIKVLEINNDITLQKQTEAALRESEERRRLALDLTHIGFWDFHLVSGKLIWNDNLSRLLGLDPYSIEPTYQLWRSHVHPDDVDWVEQRFLESIENCADYAVEYRVVHGDGSVHWLMGRGKTIRDELGLPVRSLGVLLDISDRKRTEEALRQSEAKFRSLCECSPVGIFMTDIQGQCTYTNPRYQIICGCTFDEALGEGWVQFIHPEDREEVASRWLKAVSQREEFSDEIRYVYKDGTIRFGRVQSAPIFSVSGELMGYVGTVEDVTESRVIETMKNEFISIVSHELRTPLTSIRGSLGLVTAGVFKNKPEAAQRMLDIAAQDTERLVRLVNDILDLERLEAHKVKLDKQWCDAAKLMQQSVETVQSLAASAKITLCVEPTSIQVLADGDRIIQTLVNLVSNAIKFSPPETTVTLSVQDKADRVLFQVKDLGRGIPADKLETIFGRFQQVDASDSRQKGGTGLGLAICKSIVQQHGGKIWVESVVSEGSSFFFTLPKPLD